MKTKTSEAVTMFDLPVALTNAGIFAIVATSVGLGIPSIPPWIILLLIAIAGSASAVGFRFMSGHIQDRRSRLLALFTGTAFSLAAEPFLSSFLKLEGLEAGVFVLVMSLFWARLAKHISTDFDVAKFFDGVLSRFTKK